jgi:hypothetical protein
MATRYRAGHPPDFAGYPAVVAGRCLGHPGRSVESFAPVRRPGSVVTCPAALQESRTRPELSATPVRRRRSNELDEPAGPAPGVGRSFSHPGIEELDGVGPPRSGGSQGPSCSPSLAIARATDHKRFVRVTVRDIGRVLVPSVEPSSGTATVTGLHLPVEHCQRGRARPRCSRLDARC